TLGPSGFPSLGYPLTRGLGKPVFAPGQGQAANPPANSSAPEFEYPFSGDTVTPNFLIKVRRPLYTPQFPSPLQFTDALLETGVLTPTGWQNVTLPLPTIEGVPSVPLDTDVATSLPKGDYRIRAQATGLAINGIYYG